MNCLFVNFGSGQRQVSLTTTAAMATAMMAEIATATATVAATVSGTFPQPPPLSPFHYLVVVCFIRALPIVFSLSHGIFSNLSVTHCVQLAHHRQLIVNFKGRPLSAHCRASLPVVLMRWASFAHHPSCPLPPLPSPVSLAPPLPIAFSQDHSLQPSWLIVISLIAGGARAMILSSLLLGFVALVPPPAIFPLALHLPHSPLHCLSCCPGSSPSVIVFLRAGGAEQALLGGGGVGVLVWEKLHAVLFFDHVCTISQPGRIHKTNCLVPTTIWMSQRYGQSNLAKQPILAPIICTHPLTLVMACWCQSWQKRVRIQCTYSQFYGRRHLWYVGRLRYIR